MSAVLMAGGNDEVPSAERAEPAFRALRPGARIDRYVVEAVLGKGGMGIVYAAHDSALARPVAVKLIRPDFDHSPEDARARLLREARAMARLTHANVVTIHDVGMFEDQLFVAMEFVDGMTLKRWLQDGHPWREVLRAFVQAGRGLEAAHAVELVHRDFKPENVLCGSDGRVRVTDFGVAHLASDLGETARGTQPRPSGAELFRHITGTGLHFGTPAYMSPEQHLEVATDARTDQFSFCVALYEALYGQPPFDGETLSKLTEQVLAGAIRSPPSSSPVPNRVRRAILRGLSTAPADRFPSMRALLYELEEALSMKRRRRALVIAGVGLAAVGVLAARIHRTPPCSGAAVRLSSEWNEQTKQAVGAAILASGNPYAAEASMRTTAALDEFALAWRASSTESCLATERHEQSHALLDLRAACLNERLDELSALVRVLRGSAAEVATKSVSAAQALTPVSTCDVGQLLKTEQLPDDPDRRALIAHVRKQVAEATALRAAGLYPQALDHAEQAARSAEPVGYLPAVAQALLRLGFAEHDLGRSAASTVTLARAMTAGERAGLDDIRAEAAIETVRAFTHVARYDDAEKSAVTAEAILDRLHRPPLLEIDRRNAMCVLRLSQEKFAEAKEHCARSLAILEALPSPPEDKLARAYSNLGNAELRLGEPDAAIAHERKSLSILEQYLGPNNTNVAEQLDEVGGMLSFVGKYEEAEALQARAFAIADKTFNAEQPAFAVMLGNYADTLRHLGKLELAEKMQRRSLQIFEKNEPYPGYRAHVLLGLGQISMAQGKFAEAKEELDRALAVAVEVNGPDGTIAGETRRILGELARRLGKFDEAIALHERVLASTVKLHGTDHPDVSSMLRALGEDHLAAKDGKRALERFARALAIDQKSTDSTAVESRAGDQVGIDKAKALLGSSR